MYEYINPIILGTVGFGLAILIFLIIKGKRKPEVRCEDDVEWWKNL